MKTVRLGNRNIAPTKIICVGKNYPDHIREMGGADARPSEPTIFLKPNSAVVAGSETAFLPQELGLVHHEVELCFMAGKEGKEIAVDEAASFIGAYGVGIDFTLRDRQAAAKKAGGPWDLAKGFDGSALFGDFFSADAVSDPCALAISLKLNGKVKQNSNTREMIFSPAEVISFVSRFMTIEEGDVFMCGTPAGVGEIKHGDVILAEIEGLPRLEFAVLRHRQAC